MVQVTIIRLIPTANLSQALTSQSYYYDGTANDSYTLWGIDISSSQNVAGITGTSTTDVLPDSAGDCDVNAGDKLGVGIKRMSGTCTISCNSYGHYMTVGPNNVIQRSKITSSAGPTVATTTYIEILTPPPDVASTTFDVTYRYSIATTTDYTHIRFSLCALSYPSDDCVITSTSPVTVGEVVEESFELTSERMGYHLLLVNFWNGVDETVTCDCAWWDFQCQILCTPEVVMIGTGDSVNFNIATTTIVADVPLWIENMDFCSGFSGIVDSAMCNGVAFLFMPSNESFTRILNLQKIIAEKQPWGFIPLVFLELQAISATATTPTAVQVDVGLFQATMINPTGIKATMDDLGMNSDEVSSIIITFLWFMAIGVVVRWAWGMGGVQQAESSGQMTIGNSRHL